MKPMSKELIDLWTKEIDDQVDFLKNHGWTETENYKWKSPDGQSTFDHTNAWCRLICGILKDKGWRFITEIRHLGRKEWNKVDKWARYQSPVTKRVYGYPDAEYFVKNNWEEGDLDKCSGSSKMLSELVGDNFEGDIVETWFHRKDGTEEYVLDFWEE